MSLIIYIVGVLTLALVLWWVWRFTSKESYTGLGLGKAINGGDLPGNPVDKGKIASANECRAKCAATNGCTHFTWLGPNAIFPNTCWLKKKDGGGAVQEWTDSYSGEVGGPDIPEMPSGGGGGAPSGNFATDITNKHNAYRKTRSAAIPNLTWDDGLAQDACVTRDLNVQHGSMGHWNPKGGAENVAWWDSNMGGVDAWWREHEAGAWNCDPSDVACMWPTAGHYANMVNSGSTKLGCCHTGNEGANSYLVCRYG